MEVRRQEYRAALALQRNIPTGPVPEVSPATIWELYADEKAEYEDRQELYKIRFKEVNETFPQENRKLFQMVKKAICANFAACSVLRYHVIQLCYGK